MDAPKYGNDDDYVDLVVARLYKDWSDLSASHISAFGGKNTATGVSISHSGGRSQHRCNS